MRNGGFRMFYFNRLPTDWKRKGIGDNIVYFLFPIILRQLLSIFLSNHLSFGIKSQNLHLLGCVCMSKNLKNTALHLALNLNEPSPTTWCHCRYSCPPKALFNTGELLPYLEEMSFSNRVQPHMLSRCHKEGEFFSQLGKPRVCASWQTELGSIYWAASAERRALLSLANRKIFYQRGGRGIWRELIHL